MEKLKLSKCYVFFDDSYYDNPGCSCCPETYMECFNSEDTSPSLGSAHSVEDCWVQAIISEIGRYNISDDYEESLWYMSLEDLKEEAKNLNIEVIVE